MGATGSGTCIDCPAGKYSSATGSGTCIDCPAGKYSSVTGATGSGTCIDCPAGKYSITSGSGTCIDCPAGKYSTAKGATNSVTCVNCPAGTYSSVTGATGSETCLACPKNTYSKNGWEACKPPPANGTVNQNQSNFQCNTGYRRTDTSCDYINGCEAPDPCAQTTFPICLPKGTNQYQCRTAGNIKMYTVYMKRYTDAELQNMNKTG